MGPPSGGIGIKISDSVIGTELSSANDEMARANTQNAASLERVEKLEDLILEAYSCMQIDGEYIILPDEVAEKLHRASEQIQDSREEEQIDENLRAGENLSSRSAAATHADLQECNLRPNNFIIDLPEPEKEKEQIQGDLEGGVQDLRSLDVSRERLSVEEKAKQHKLQNLNTEAGNLGPEIHNRQVPPAASSNIFIELVSLPEADENTSSGSPSPLSQHIFSNSGEKISTPNLSISTHRQGHLAPDRLTLAPNSVTDSYQITPDQLLSSKCRSKILTYEKRRDAAIKLKEDKKIRELRIRESARKQREDSKRKLEEVQQREMEEKRERVRRIREERLIRRTGKTTIAHGSKQDGQF
ncbi:hypothetical protein Plhal304r1_c009g0035851 [Plasmopara halstedii]